MPDPEIPDNVNTVPAEGTTWVEIASTGGDEEARLMQGFLEAAGIPAQVENVKFSMEPINFGTMGDIRLYVPAEHEAEAQRLLRDRDQQAERLDEDGETVVTDEGPATIEDESQTVNDDGAKS
jgi:hypothetical protein